MAILGTRLREMVAQPAWVVFSGDEWDSDDMMTSDSDGGAG